MKQCTKCLSPESYPKIAFNDEGMCNYCQGFEKASRLGLLEERSEQELKEELLRFKKKSGYDCMVLFSGGKDSTFSLLKIKQWGLNPLAFTKDLGNGPSETLHRNMNKAIKKLDVDQIIYKHNLPQVKDFFHFLIKGKFLPEEEQRAYSYRCKICHFFLIFEAGKLAESLNIPVIVDSATTGQRISEDYLLHVDSPHFEYKKRMSEMMGFHRAVAMIREGCRVLQDSPRLNSIREMFEDFSENHESIFSGIHFVYPTDYFHHSVEEMKSILKEELDWSVPVEGSDLMGKGDNYIASGCQFWRIFFHLSLRNVGYHSEYPSLNEEIRRGRITRDHAVRAFTESLHTDEEIYRDLLDLNFSQSEAKNLLTGDKG